MKHIFVLKDNTEFVYFYECKWFTEEYVVGTSWRRNVTQSEEASETSISSRVKTNLSTMDFYLYLCFPCPGESFSVLKLCLRKKERF